MELVDDVGSPPWARVPGPPHPGTALYAALPGDRDEPPSTLCTGCGAIDGRHRARCAVEAHEAEEEARWADAQREAGNPALAFWDDLVASTDGVYAPDEEDVRPI